MVRRGTGWAPLDSYDLDEEDKERTTQFAEALKDGAFDFFLSVAADVRPPDWQDPTRVGLQQWMQRKTPMLAFGGCNVFRRLPHSCERATRGPLSTASYRIFQTYCGGCVSRKTSSGS